MVAIKAVKMPQDSEAIMEATIQALATTKAIVNSKDSKENVI